MSKIIFSQTKKNGEVVNKSLTDGTLNVLAEIGSKYSIKEFTTNKIPAGTTLRRKGKDLVIEINDKEVVILNDFYDSVPAEQAPMFDSGSLAVLETDDIAQIATAAKTTGAHFLASLSPLQIIAGILGAIGLGGIATKLVSNMSNRNDGTDVVNITKDTEVSAPLVSLTRDTGNSSDSITSDAGVTVKGLEKNAKWEYSLDGANWVTGNGDTIPPSVFMNDGSYTVHVRQTDPAGNVSP
ncbi:TPA: hypothetical protein QCG78_004391, partial [Enterobacter asburiae]|nr:hypothetical protein [Enterobacter asburiae]